MNVEDFFSSGPRMKILKMLHCAGELNASEIARRLGLNNVSTNRHLRILEDEGVLQCKMFGRIRLYRIDEESFRAKAVQNLIEVWEQQTTADEAERDG